MMGLPAIVQQPVSMTEVETKAATEAIFASSNLAICVAPSLGQKRPRHRIRNFQRHAATGKYFNRPPVKGKAGECAGLAHRRNC
ncbi:hypothetical protein CN311_31620 [Mesorhizobium sanjuanii]|uniref:Uncharacterized protein n=1 Tax=Mesorhizobium sanjuanii TaxID=2037900 RepID=A0A2A6F5R5_9HYPH|nr:hypothetical protein CN311_31620 [Mesorhizobium sanjuanii]